MKMLRMQLSYVCIPVLQVRILSNPAVPLLSFTSLTAELLLVSFPHCEAWRLAKHSPQPGSPLHWSFIRPWACPRSCCMNQHQCRPEKWLHSAKALYFPAVALPWESFGTCSIAPHRQQRAHLDKCLWRDCGFGLQRKTGTEVLWSVHFTKVISVFYQYLFCSCWIKIYCTVNTVWYLQSKPQIYRIVIMDIDMIIDLDSTERKPTKLQSIKY